LVTGLSSWFDSLLLSFCDDGKEAGLSDVFSKGMVK